MRFQVVLTQRAVNDLEAARAHIALSAPDTAVQWRLSVLRSLSRLETNPQFYSLAPESTQFSFELRQLFIRTRSRLANRALFTIVGNEVRVLAIRRPGQPLISKRHLG